MRPVGNELVIEQLIDSMMEVYGIMMGQEVEAGEPHTRSELDLSSEVKGAIGLTGDFPGILALNMSRSAAAQAVELLLGTPADDVTSAEVMDTVGEMTNMIAGGLKTRLSDGPGTAIDISLPTVLIGDDYEYETAGTGPSIVIPIRGVDDSTYMELFCAEAELDAETDRETTVAGKES